MLRGNARFACANLLNRETRPATLLPGTDDGHGSTRFLTKSSGRHIYPKLVTLSVPPAIMVSFFAGQDIAQFVRVEGVSLSNFQMVAVFEVALIQMYRPEFQRHEIAQTRTALKKIGIPEGQTEAMLSILKVTS